MVSRDGLGVAVIGCGAVFAGGYSNELRALGGRVTVRAICDIDTERAIDAASKWSAEAVSDYRHAVEREDVDIVCVLTSMNEHAEVACAALEAGKHVLLEKPISTTINAARDVLAVARGATGKLVCAPHTLLSPTFAAVKHAADSGEIGDIYLARGRYGWSGPNWARWFYERGGGALFDLGVYNITTLCGLFGSVRRVTAFAGTALPTRIVAGEPVHVAVIDNAHVLLDFGDNRFASVATGFTMQRYRSPAIELYGTTGTMQLLGDDWAPDGHEIWRNHRASWEFFPALPWRWTAGLSHLVDCVENGTALASAADNALHVLEVMLGAEAAAETGEAVAIKSTFTPPRLAAKAMQALHRVHDPSVV
jgi:predicted dehydrogenase